MPDYMNWLPDFSALPLPRTEQEKKAEERKQKARLESGIVTANDKDKALIELNLKKAKSLQTNRQIVGTGLQLIGGGVGAMFAPEIFLPYFAVEGGKGLMDENGVKRTTQLLKGIDNYGSPSVNKLKETGEMAAAPKLGKAALSGLGDALNLSMFVLPGSRQVKEIIPAAKMVFNNTKGNIFLKLGNTFKLQSAISNFSSKINPSLIHGLVTGSIFRNPGDIRVPIEYFNNDGKAYRATTIRETTDLQNTGTTRPSSMSPTADANWSQGMLGWLKGTNYTDAVLKSNNLFTKLKHAELIKPGAKLLEVEGLGKNFRYGYHGDISPELIPFEEIDVSLPKQSNTSKSPFFLHERWYEHDGRYGTTKGGLGATFTFRGIGLKPEDPGISSEDISEFTLLSPKNKIFKYNGRIIPNKVIEYQNVPLSSSKISLAFFERPSRLTEAERLGIPKGTKIYTPEENIAFRQQINDFANKYGYEPIGEEVTDPEVLQRYARSLIKRHNTFYRGVTTITKESDPKRWSYLESVLGKNFTDELALKYMATHAPGGGAGELYMSPYSEVAGLYGKTVEITRPFTLGPDRTKWFTEGDFPLVDNAGHRDMLYYDYFSGLTDPWNGGYYRVIGKPFSIDGWTKKFAATEFTPEQYISGTTTVPSEITSRNLVMIPQKIHESMPAQVASKKITDTPWHWTTITEKNGGTLNYLNFFK